MSAQPRWPAPAELLPHRAPMVLIDRIEHWDPERIVCRADSHHAKDNPLRQEGHLSVHAGVEYAAQAMAAHARLEREDEGGAPARGFLAVGSKIRAHAQYLDAAPGPLRIEASPLARNPGSSLYQFRIESDDGQPLLEGRLTAIIEDARAS